MTAPHDAAGACQAATVTPDYLIALGMRALPAMYDAGTGQFVHTMRGYPGAEGPVLRAEGSSARYSAICALGLHTLTRPAQEAVLAGARAAELARATANRAITHTEPGAQALALWAVLEVAADDATRLVEAVRATASKEESQPTVELSWALVALTMAAASGREDLWPDVERLACRLLSVQEESGLFQHAVGERRARAMSRVDISCFADQVYPVVALARLHSVRPSGRLLDAATATARAICALQGEQGQWWWHYHTQAGIVAEKYPVYSVHQHAMGPLALRELQAAGGPDLSAHTDLGMRWLQTHPEVISPLIDETLPVVWRKAARREPAKLVRRATAALSVIRPVASLPAVDTLFPPSVIDHESRPYEIGWLLYTWGREPTQPTVETD